jgi:hypothetical protein
MLGGGRGLVVFLVVFENTGEPASNQFPGFLAIVCSMECRANILLYWRAAHQAQVKAPAGRASALLTWLEANGEGGFSIPAWLGTWKGRGFGLLCQVKVGGGWDNLPRS